LYQKWVKAMGVLNPSATPSKEMRLDLYEMMVKDIKKVDKRFKKTAKEIILETKELTAESRQGG
ncbi:unnamed protein product, partial [marine sediment metagenome]